MMAAAPSIRFREYIRYNQISNISRGIGRYYQIRDVCAGFLDNIPILEPAIVQDIFDSSGMTRDLDMDMEAVTRQLTFDGEDRDEDEDYMYKFLVKAKDRADDKILELEGILEDRLESGAEISFVKFSEYRRRSRDE